MIAEAPLAETMALFAQAQAGDADAQATFKTAFAPDTDCFLCGKQCGSAVVAGVFPSPKPDTALLVALCDECQALPPIYRAGKALKMVKAMFPGRRWTTTPPPRPAGRQHR